MKETQDDEAKAIAALFDRLSSSASYPFPQKREPLNAPKERGVYVIQDANGLVLHVGNTPRAKKGVHQRLKDHLSGRSSFARLYLRGDTKKLRSSCFFRYLVVPNARQRALLEAYTIGRLCPFHIGHSEIR